MIGYSFCKFTSVSVEWTSPTFKYVDTFAKHDYSNSVEKCLKGPYPAPPQHGRPPNYGIPEGTAPSADEKAEARREFR